MSDTSPHPSVWPDLNVARWAPALSLSPAQPNWMFTALLLTARGVTTGPMPWHGTAVEAALDVFSSEIVINRSDGESRRIALIPALPVARMYGALQAALEALDVACTISPIPQEVPDTTPLTEDHRPASYDPAAVQRWFTAGTATAAAFDEWRSHFFGRTGIQVWWGALDVSLMLFSGKHVPAPADRGYIMKYDLDAELMNAGLYFGDEYNAPFFYGYIYPAPAGANDLPIAPAAASWSTALGEWLLPYDAVRSAADPAAELHAFLDAIYAQCVAAAGWDAQALSYAAPPRRG